METGDLHGSFLPYDVLGRIARQACPDSLALWGFNLRSRGRTSATPGLQRNVRIGLRALDAAALSSRYCLGAAWPRVLARRRGRMRRNRRRLPPDATGFAVPITKSV